MKTKTFIKPTIHNLLATQVNAYELVKQQMAIALRSQEAIAKTIEDAQPEQVINLIQLQTKLSEQVQKLSSESRQWQKIESDRLGNMSTDEQIEAAMVFLGDQPRYKIVDAISYLQDKIGEDFIKNG